MAERSFTSWLWYETLKVPVLLVWSLGYRVRYWGCENIPSEGGVLVVSNHQSHFDPPLVGGGCRRRLSYVARQSLFGFGPFRWLIRSLDAIPIDREGSGLGGIKETIRRLRRGEMVLIFPEGTRTSDGQVGPFRPGFTTLAARGRAAILPAAIEGAFRVWPRWRKLPWLGTIHVRYGEAIPAERVKESNPEELMAEVRNRVLRCHAELRRHPIFARGQAARRG